MSNTPPNVGAIRLHDAALPALPGGLYRLTSTVEVTRIAGNAPLGAPPPRETHIRVAGPRWALDDSEIATRHPPENARGAFWDRLPHVSLGRRTLPWERPLADGTPWLAMLVVAPGEGDLASGTLRGLLPPAVVSALPDLGTDDPTVRVLKIHTLAAFQALLPSRADVRLLAHVREVNVADTALAGSDDDGSFAVVTANRLPILAPGTQTTAYLACLVSLESRDDVWTVPAGAAPPPLIVLASWNFTVSATGGTFEELARQLDIAPFGAPAAGGAPLLDAAGTVAVDRVGRTGERTGAHYRGPLLGTRGDQALPSAPDDLSAPAAVELGRLLGAADGRFLRELVAWHRADEAAARAETVRASLDESLGNGAGRERRSARGGAPAARLSNAAVHDALSTQLVQGAGPRAELWQVHPAAQTLADRAARRKQSAVKKRVTKKGPTKKSTTKKSATKRGATRRIAKKSAAKAKRPRQPREDR